MLDSGESQLDSGESQSITLPMEILVTFWLYHKGKAFKAIKQIHGVSMLGWI